MSTSRALADSLISYGSLALGLFQLAAIAAGLSHWLGWHWSITLLLGVPLAMIPLAGTAGGIAGAIYGWGWPLERACVYFLIPVAILSAAYLLLHLTRKKEGNAAPPPPP